MFCDAESVFGQPGDYYCIGSPFLCDGGYDCPMREDESEELCASGYYFCCIEIDYFSCV